MASKKLTSDEVNALMEGLQDSPQGLNIDVSASDDVRPFAFGEDDLTLMGDYYALRQVNERFARQARTVFLPMLRIQPRITSFAPEVKTFDEYCASIDAFMNLNISRIEELRGAFLMAIPPKFISTHVTPLHFIPLPKIANPNDKQIETLQRLERFYLSVVMDP